MRCQGHDSTGGDFRCPDILWKATLQIVESLPSVDKVPISRRTGPILQIERTINAGA